MPVVIVELQEKPTRRFVRQEIRQVQSAEPAALHLTADEQPAQAILRLAAQLRARQARQA